MKKRRILYVLFIIVLMIFSTVSLYFFFYFNDIRENNNYQNRLIINESNDMSYNLETNDGRYYNSKSTYGTYNINDIKNINTYFNYSLNFDKKVTGEYSYIILGNIIDSKKDKHQVYKSNEYKYEINDSNIINITNSFDINMPDIINRFNEIKGLSDISGKVIYEVLITYHVYNEEINSYVANSKSLNMIIPFDNSNNIEISKNSKREIKEFSNNNNANDYTYLVICLEFLGSSILFILIIVWVINLINPKVSIYEKDLKYILNKYKKKIIKISFIPNINDKEVIFVDDMDSLVDASNTFKVPIDYIEVVKGKEAVFMVIVSRYAYVYKLSIKRNLK